ncbi:hypothetical protein K6K41_13800 [Chenggangzhangella methanolivorans]|uniref:Uncharacterized protein n=1 Tax=Chenggangzhangella methanolivorans TaxID=1437009 RepID=A0A9E6RJ15_9HYPH|nr:hypothetical protein K6K41_13800 [Chenggangzhangella methanolivorans]
MVSLASSAAQAEGFAAKDLTTVADAAKAALGGDYAHRAEAARLTLTCPTCKGEPMIDVLVSRQDDGTEARVRSGQTTVAQLEKLCRAKVDACRITELKVAPAVGWLSAYPMGAAMAGSTAVILRDGDLLTIRSLASDPAVAKRNAETLAASIAPKIVGR